MTVHESLAATLQSQWPGLANHLWRSTLFGLAILVLLRLVRLPLRTRYRACLLAACAFLVPSAVWAPLFRPLVPPAVGGGTATSAMAATALLSRVAEPVPIPADDDPFEPRSVRHASDAAPVVMAHHELPCVLGLTWLAGTVALAAHWARSFRAHTRRSRRGRPPSPAERAALDDALREVNVRRRVTLSISPDIPEPSVRGLRAPAIDLPEGLSTTLGHDELVAILVHELVHLARRDNLVDLLQRGLACVLWFHPLAWWLDRRLRRERELCCDERALARRVDPNTYATALLKTVRFCLEAPVAGVSYAHADLPHRIGLILSARGHARATGPRWTVPALALTFAALSGSGSARARFDRLALTPPRNAGDVTPAAHRLNPAELAALERQIAAEPDNFALRLRAIRHYATHHTSRGGRAPHLLWLIAHAPGSEPAGGYEAEVTGGLELDLYATARRLWRSQIERHPQDAAVLANAARFFRRDEALAERLLMAAVALEPENPRWHERLGEQRVSRIRSSGKPSPPVAAGALESFEAALARTRDAESRERLLAAAAEAALQAEDTGTADQYAGELLRVAAPPRQNLRNHEAHRILGTSALQRGDGRSAAWHLVRAAEAATADTSPDLTLADALLVKGERDAVIQYLNRIARTFPEGGDGVDEWLVLIRAGRTPILKWRLGAYNTPVAPPLSSAGGGG